MYAQIVPRNLLLSEVKCQQVKENPPYRTRYRNWSFMGSKPVQDDTELLGDSKEVPISEWSGWRFNSRHEIFSLLDGKTK